jgi:hypothetical protein
MTSSKQRSGVQTAQGPDSPLDAMFVVVLWVLGLDGRRCARAKVENEGGRATRRHESRPSRPLFDDDSDFQSQ